MSEKFKLKYEVVAILRDNILKGLESFGIPISESPNDGGWICMEADQPSFRNADNAILFWMEKAERLGLQSDRNLYNRETGKFDVVDYFIEQQLWKIKVISKRTTAPITENNIPLTTEDVTCMLIGWFNRLGCEEFRKHNMANLFVQSKDIRTYKDKSDVNQWTTEFPLKLQVIKQFETELDTATPVYGGTIPLEGKPIEDISGETDIEEDRSQPNAPLQSRTAKFLNRVKNLLIGNFQG